MTKIGISTACFYPLYLEDALKRITNFDVYSCEIFFNSFCELEKPFVRELKNIADGSGLKVTSVHPFLSGIETFLFFSAYSRRTDDGVDIYRRHFEAARYLGADTFVFHGGSKSTPFSGMERYAESYERLYRAAKEFDVIFTHENVSRTVSADISFIKELKKQLGDIVKFTFDLKQSVRAGENPLEMISAMGNSIKNVHINDFDMTKKECRLPCDGNCDIPTIISKIKSFGYDGNYIIEVYSDNYKSDDQISTSIKKLREII